jgi:hypothetical protein
MSRLARRRGHAGSCPTRLGRGAIRGAAKKQTPTRVPRRASLAFGVRALVMQDGEIAARGWRGICRRARRETHLGGRGDGGLRGEHLGGRRHGDAEGQGRGHLSVCARTQLCVPRLLAALSSRERETRRSPGREARVYWSTRSTSALADETAKRFRGRDFLNPERRVRASRPNRKGGTATVNREFQGDRVDVLFCFLRCWCFFLCLFGIHRISVHSRSANRAALRAERATSTSRRAASARNGVLTYRSASFGRRACRERRVRFASPSRRGVVARRKRIGRLNPRPTVQGSVAENGVREKRPIRDRAVLRAK